MSRASDIARRLTSEGRAPEEIRDAAYLSTGDVAAKQTRFWLLLALSAAIATAGIVADSTATVIGAMVMVTTRFDGTTLVLLVEGMSDGPQDEALPALLQGAVPDGTKVVVNRIAGSRRELGAVR